ncbi:unnamed protein product, partial [Prunus brigantina]
NRTVLAETQQISHSPMAEPKTELKDSLSEYNENILQGKSGQTPERSPKNGEEIRMEDILTRSNYVTLGLGSPIY